MKNEWEKKKFRHSNQMDKKEKTTTQYAKEKWHLRLLYGNESGYAYLTSNLKIRKTSQDDMIFYLTRSTTLCVQQLLFGWYLFASIRFHTKLLYSSKNMSSKISVHPVFSAGEMLTLWNHLGNWKIAKKCVVVSIIPATNFVP